MVFEKRSNEARMTFEFALCYLAFDWCVHVEDLTKNANQNSLVAVDVAVAVADKYLQYFAKIAEMSHCPCVLARRW